MAAGAAALPVPAGGEIAFDVLRNGDVIGVQRLLFTTAGDTLSIANTVSLSVTLASIVLFRYELQATERWQDGVFQSLDSNINFNGDALQVHAEKVAGGYAVEGHNADNPAKNVPRYLAPPDTLPLTYWNKRMLSGTILNIQTAHSYKVNVASPGWNKLPTADGGTITAQRFDLSGKLVLSVWYDAAGSWAGLEFNKSGDITYRKHV
jgi:hypothetical protein